MKKYPFLLAILLLLLVVMISGCTNKNDTNATKSYSQNGISFVYNGTWEIANTTSPNAIVAVGDPKTVDSQNDPYTFVLIQKPNATQNADLQTTYTENYNKFFNNTTNQRVSEANITLNNNKAFENVYISDFGGVQRQMRAVWLVQNGVIYVILCGTIPANFDNEQKNFDLVINSFKAQ
jgi:hypothetical protein